MAKVYFYYAAMNAGKSTVLLQSAHNYQERGMRVLLFASALDDRYGKGFIASRIGIKSEALIYSKVFDFFGCVKAEHEKKKVDCVLIDEAQFLTKLQVKEIARIADDLDIPVLAYGLRTDFQGVLFEGSQALLALAEELVEIKTICACGRKAIMNARLNEKGEVQVEGSQIEIGGNERYESMCRRCYVNKSTQKEIKNVATA